VFVRRSLLGAGLAAVLAVGASAPAAHAAVTDNQVKPDATTVHAQVRAGTLLATHGVRAMCKYCQVRVVTTAPGSNTVLSTNVPAGYGATDLAAIYHLPAAPVGAAGGTVAIIDAGADPNLESDLNTYRAQYGLPACTVASGCLKMTNKDGGPPLTPDPTDIGKIIEESVAVETMLDMEMASAACPSCKLVEVQTPPLDLLAENQDELDLAMAHFGDAVNTAVSLGAGAVSMSYQFPGDATVQTGPTGRALFHPGVAVLASSGDSGFEGDQHTGWPQNLPWVVSVGGTTVFQQGNGYREQAWSGAGSGCETDLPAAIGQPASVSKLCGGHRASSDVSAIADPATGVAVYDTYSPNSGQPYEWIVVGGTSASSPFIGGLYARGGRTAGVLGPNTLYAAPKGAFYDVTVGQNAPAHVCPTGSPLCYAGKRWDGPTGVGSPRGLAGF